MVSIIAIILREWKALGVLSGLGTGNLEMNVSFGPSASVMIFNTQFESCQWHDDFIYMLRDAGLRVDVHPEAFFVSANHDARGPASRARVVEVDGKIHIAN